MPSCAVPHCKTNTDNKLHKLFKIPAINAQATGLFRRKQIYRQELWQKACHVTQITNNTRICAWHFVSGKPACFEAEKDVDWVPTLNLNLVPHSKSAQKAQTLAASRAQIAYPAVGPDTIVAASRSANPFGTFAFASPVSSRSCGTPNVVPTQLPDVAGTVTKEVPSRTGNPSVTSASASPVSSRNEAPTLRPDVSGTVKTEDPSRTGNTFGTFFFTSPVSSRCCETTNVAATPQQPQEIADSSVIIEEEMGNGEDHEDVHDQFLSADLDLSFNSQREDPTWKFQIEAAPAVIYNNVARAATPTLDPSVRANPVFQHQPGTSSPINVNAHVIQSVDAPAVAFMWTNPTANPPTGAEWNQPAGPLSTHPQNLESLPQEHADSVEEEMGNGEDHEDVHDQFLSADLDLSFNSQREDPTWKFQIEAAPAVIYNNVASTANPTIEPSVRANLVFQHQPASGSKSNRFLISPGTEVTQFNFG
ncbi:conserved hypothetical protein [Culex quinquefasciatus]|uniref:THAP-type domain-containing protein n=1 Tax=Culex quinquefasciatus TaxID=7176 RepID=B0XI26_CULQU|nr:conserved hypothetical protein [Culex quinquefasciatus]|eukprot:XP_001869298.1 conserved hypothetical protein [Culex quinquefasciatus]